MRNLILTFFLLLGTAVSTAGVPATQLTETDAIRWDTSLSLPQLDGTPNIGIAGAFSGRVDGKLLIAGGANFPDRTPEANGEKRYHRDLYIYDASRGWQVIRDALPAPRAYGISVTLPEGVLCIGGCDASDCTDQVSLLTLDGAGPASRPGLRSRAPWPMPQGLWSATASMWQAASNRWGGEPPPPATSSCSISTTADADGRNCRRGRAGPGVCGSGFAKRRIRQLFLPVQRPRLLGRFGLDRSQRRVPLQPAARELGATRRRIPGHGRDGGAIRHQPHSADRRPQRDQFRRPDAAALPHDHGNPYGSSSLR